MLMPWGPWGSQPTPTLNDNRNPDRTVAMTKEVLWRWRHRTVVNSTRQWLIWGRILDTEPSLVVWGAPRGLYVSLPDGDPSCCGVEEHARLSYSAAMNRSRSVRWTPFKGFFAQRLTARCRRAGFRCPVTPPRLLPLLDLGTHLLPRRRPPGVDVGRPAISFPERAATLTGGADVGRCVPDFTLCRRCHGPPVQVLVARRQPCYDIIPGAAGCHRGRRLGGIHPAVGDTCFLGNQHGQPHHRGARVLFWTSWGPHQHGHRDRGVCTTVHRQCTVHSL